MDHITDKDLSAGADNLNRFRRLDTFERRRAARWVCSVISERLIYGADSLSSVESR